MRVQDPRLVGLSFAIVSAFCFGGSGPFAKPLINAGMPPLQVAWVRLVGGALLLLPFAVRHVRLVRTHPKLLLGYGLFAIAGVQTWYFAAIARIPVSVALLIEFLGPVLVLCWIRLVLGKPVTRASVVGIAVSMAGLTCVVEVWSGTAFDPLGLLFALASAGCQAAYFLLSDSGAEVDPLGLSAFGLLVGAALVTVVARPWESRWQPLAGEVVLAGQPVPALFAVAWVVVLGTVLAYLSGIVAVRRLSPPVAGAVAFLEPVVATMLAWVLLGEHLGPVQLLGGGLILLGAYIAQRASRSGGWPPKRGSVDQSARTP